METPKDKLNRIAVKATISGSFKRDPEGLAQIYADLTASGCDVLSPVSAEPVRQEDGFIFMKGDGFDPVEIERRHLHAIEDSDFLWLHAPAGYVGVSAAMEIGWAVANGIPIFTVDTPSDPVLQDMVTRVKKLKIGSYTGLVIQDDDGNFLTLRFTQKKERPWRFAGGKIEPGETLISAAARELKEELGVEASSMRLVDVHTDAVDSGIWVGYYFLAEVIGRPQIMEPDKHDHIRFMTVQELEEAGAYPETEVAIGVQ